MNELKINFEIYFYAVTFFQKNFSKEKNVLKNEKLMSQL